MTSYGGAVAFWCIFAVLFCGVFADLAPYQSCTYPEGHPPSACTIHELRVDPCPEGAQGKPCRLKRGRNATIEFDYTADFEGETLEGHAFWVNNVIEMPFIGMQRDACLSTACPVVPGKKQTYRLVLFIAKSYPVRSYDVKWKIQNAQGQDCCFIYQIKIHK